MSAIGVTADKRRFLAIYGLSAYDPTPTSPAFCVAVAKGLSIRFMAGGALKTPDEARLCIATNNRHSRSSGSGNCIVCNASILNG